MKRQVLGLDINDEYVAATVIRMSGNEKVVTAFGFEQFHNKDELAEVLPLLLEKVGWREGKCVCGISLSGVSVRNISIPFTESRKIEQILPLELEDQLLHPVRNQLIEYIVSRVEENQSHLLVTALEKDAMQHDLDLLNVVKLKPETVTMRTIVLAEQLQKLGDLPDGFILVDADLHAARIAIVIHEKIVFVRRLDYPDKVITDQPFVFGSEGAKIAYHEEAIESFISLCKDIKRSMGLYQLESGIDYLPEKIVLTGSMAQIPECKDRLESDFEGAVELGNLRELASVKLDEGVQEEWYPGLYDHSLSLALQGFGRKATINFRKDEFALSKLYRASQTYLAAAAGVFVLILAGIFIYLGYDYRTLDSRYDVLGDRMKVLFKETFPETTRIVDPLVQMKTNLRNVQAPSIATPIFSGDKRALNILADISGRVPTSIEIHVARLVIDNESVMLKGTTDTFNNVNLIQSVLRKSPAYEDVDIVSAAAERDSGLIRFELKLKTAGAT